MNKKNGYTIYVHLPRKDEMYRNKGVKVEPKCHRPKGRGKNEMKMSGRDSPALTNLFGSAAEN